MNITARYPEGRYTVPVEEVSDELVLIPSTPPQVRGLKAFESWQVMHVPTRIGVGPIKEMPDKDTAWAIAEALVDVDWAADLDAVKRQVTPLVRQVIRFRQEHAGWDEIPMSNGPSIVVPPGQGAALLAAMGSAA